MVVFTIGQGGSNNKNEVWRKCRVNEDKKVRGEKVFLLWARLRLFAASRAIGLQYGREGGIRSGGKAAYHAGAASLHPPQTARSCLFESADIICQKEKALCCCIALFLSGGEGGIRTRVPLITATRFPELEVVFLLSSLLSFEVFSSNPSLAKKALCHALFYNTHCSIRQYKSVFQRNAVFCCFRTFTHQTTDFFRTFSPMQENLSCKCGV